MADESITTVEVTAPPVVKSAARPSRADVIAGLEKLAATEADKPVEEKPADPDAPKEPEAAPVEEKPAEGKPAEPVEEKPDAETERRLSAIQKAEKRQRETIQAERKRAAAELAEEQERVRGEWSAKIDSAKKWQADRDRARRDPDALLEMLGLTDDQDVEAMAQALYVRSQAKKGAAIDPKYKAAADKVLREREQSSEVATLRKEIEAMKAERVAERQHVETERAVGAYLDGVAKAVTAESSPLVARMLEKNPTKTRTALREIAAAMAQRDDEAPDAADVIAHLEKLRRAELDELGIDYGSQIIAKKAAESVEKAESDSKPSKTLGTNGAPVRPPANKPKPGSPEHRAELLRNMPWRDS